MARPSTSEHRQATDISDIVAEIAAKSARRKLLLYRPYGHPDTLWPDGDLCRDSDFGPALIKGPWSNKPWQLDFHNAGAHFRFRMVTQGNRGGKCASVFSNLDQYGGPAGAVFGKRGPISWVRKPPEECYRIVMDDGRWFEGPAGHRILCGNGWQPISELLRAYAAARPGSIAERGPLARVVSALRWCERSLDSLAHCLVDRRQRGERLLSDEDGVQVWLPSRDGASRRSLALWKMGALASTYIHNLCSFCDRLSILGGGVRSWVRFEPSSGRIHGLGLQPSLPIPHSGRQFRERSGLPPIEFPGHGGGSFASVSPVYIEGNRIVHIYPVGVKHLYDLQSPTGSYHAAGMLHHNTYPAAAEMAMHLTGIYPDWWEGKRFDRPIDAWACGITQEKTRDVIQVLLLGDVTLPSDSPGGFGTGLIPASGLQHKPTMRHANVPGVVDRVRVKHVSGGYSNLKFKAYKQGWRDFQSDSCDLIWMDEEPNEANVDESRIFSEVLVRLADRGGILIVTMALLLGETTLVRHFHEGRRGTYLVNATWDDSPHLAADVKEDLADNIPEHERDARMRGAALLGTGRVFKASEAMISIPPREIPKWWWQICGVDFGIDHPAAGVWLAIDRDADVWYLIDCYRASNQLPVYHASQIKRRGAWIPVAWPHDGLKRGPADGKVLKEAYEDEGVNMLPFSARYSRDSGGSQAIEPIVIELNERMMTGRFKAFNTCYDFFDEFKSFHRDEKGVIVAKRDDVISALRYAAMMQAYASQEVIVEEKPLYQRALM